jgi:hypothetical protein
MVRQAHHERLNLVPNTRKLLFIYLDTIAFQAEGIVIAVLSIVED